MINNIVVKNAKVIWRNFSGAASQYNRAGNRNFTLVIEDPEMAQDLIRDGWNIKTRQPKEEGQEPLYTLEVTVRFEHVPPKIMLVTSRNRVRLDEESVNILDVAEIRQMDVAVRPHMWEVNGKTGVKAYLKTLYAVQEEDEFECDYEDPEDNALPF